MNDFEFKKSVRIFGVFVLLFVLILCFVSFLFYRSYTLNFNEKIDSVVSLIKKNYPNVTDDEIMDVLNDNSSGFLEKYGIDVSSSAVLENDLFFKRFIFILILVIAIFSFVFLFVFSRNNKKKNKDILEIADYVSRINNGDFHIDIDKNAEGDMSILKNEVYKTMVMLSTLADNSLNDKLTLKRFLEDISHQIKTPLTSILLSLDNLECADKKAIKVIKKDVLNISFLVQSILKLSRFDTNTVDFINSEVNLSDFLNSSLEKVSALSELKGIDIDVLECDNVTINFDSYWQCEALTNVLKNAVEHASSLVTVNVLKNNVFLEISITNDGDLISSNDLKHVFERFYRGKGALNDSVGIGLALSKAIIESAGGMILVDNKGKTTFKIRYFNLKTPYN